MPSTQRAAFCTSTLFFGPCISIPIFGCPASLSRALFILCRMNELCLLAFISKFPILGFCSFTLTSQVPCLSFSHFQNLTSLNSWDRSAAYGSFPCLLYYFPSQFLNLVLPSQFFPFATKYLAILVPCLNSPEIRDTADSNYFAAIPLPPPSCPILTHSPLLFGQSKGMQHLRHFRHELPPGTSPPSIQLMTESNKKLMMAYFSLHEFHGSGKVSEVEYILFQIKWGPVRVS